MIPRKQESALTEGILGRRRFDLRPQSGRRLPTALPGPQGVPHADKHFRIRFATEPSGMPHFHQSAALLMALRTRRQQHSDIIIPWRLSFMEYDLVQMAWNWKVLEACC